ncbi:MAG: 50S ribosomal protein L28 [Chlorobium phaeobacteroides]|uniref:Large ribosomal subunit protein bL28 n=1 Tax=Chlorobium phaeobacteroides (strain BS1) TaxID=331678 RepID=RL28_CHLPB|nr:RecName: Full=Large ribosomal subunit protein bL28; AltName: Full=50S ribosomal protein L28 [Chlorobium phaeobacteroides BS1]MBC8524500.1 50S ribosomal protein L28 [Chlorobium phaeobacteroides]MBL6955970.1 50S ribosomal protein L28 [Chlorobium phaeobacteroides]NEX13349.1 50S ribosomal protein L28 [Prosthecochloris sp.]
MSKVCILTGKRPTYGNNVSHANNRTRKRFEPNLHTKRIWVEEEKRWVKVRVSAKAMKIMSKTGTAELAKLIR